MHRTTITVLLLGGLYMINILINEVQEIIEEIYSVAHETCDESEEAYLSEFVASIRYYERILHEIKSVDDFNDPINTEQQLQKIRKDLSDVLTMII
jgi:hypothetical protein